MTRPAANREVVINRALFPERIEKTTGPINFLQPIMGPGRDASGGTVSWM